MSKIVTVLLVLLAVVIGAMIYLIYLLPAYWEKGGQDCFFETDPRRAGYHTDYILPLQSVRWSSTVICGVDPPVQIFGNQDYHRSIKGGHKLEPRPIPLPGEWQVSYAAVKTGYWRVHLPYLAITLPGGYHARLGFRWDDVDDFYTFSVSIKKIVPNLELNLWRKTFG